MKTPLRLQRPHFWLVVLFFIYCAMRELVRAIGKDKVVSMFFEK